MVVSAAVIQDGNQKSEKLSGVWVPGNVFSVTRHLLLVENMGKISLVCFGAGMAGAKAKIAEMGSGFQSC
jgi:hypothetical protein